MKLFFNKFVFAIFNECFLKKIYFSKFKLFKFFLQIKIMLNIVNFNNDNYKFVKTFVRFIFTYSFFLMSILKNLSLILMRKNKKRYS